MEGVILTPLKIIPTVGGDVLHGMKCIDPGFVGFGEAYFSTVNYQDIKPWKKHLRMTLNVVVPFGEIRFVLHDDRVHSQTNGKVITLCLSRENNYQRLTVPPDIWMAFQGLSKPYSMLLNVADMLHDPNEVERCELEKFAYEWEIKE